MTIAAAIFLACLVAFGLSPAMLLPRVAKRRITRLGPNSSFSRTLSDNLIDKGLANPIIALIIRVAGQITTTAASSVLTRDAPALFAFNRIRLLGTHREIQVPTILDAPGDLVYWIGSFLSGVPQVLTAPLPNNTTGNFSMTLYVPLSLDGVPMYLDPRDYSQLTLECAVGAAADYCGTNSPTAVASMTYDVFVMEMIEGAPPVGAPHLEPLYIFSNTIIDSTQVEIASGPLGGARLARALFQVIDDSATGNSERSDGNVRRILMDQAGRRILESTWAGLRDDTMKDYPLGLTTTQPPGIAIWTPGGGYDPAEWPNLAGAAGVIKYDTATTPEQDIAAIVAAANDNASLLGLCGVFNASGNAVFEESLKAAIAAAR